MSYVPLPNLFAVCTICDQSKPLTDFYADKRKRNGRASECKECAKVRQTRYRLNNPEKVAESKRLDYERNRDRYLTYWREYDKNRPDKKERLEMLKHLKDDDPEWARNKRRKRRAIQKQATVGPSFSIQDLRDRDGEKCALCGEQLDFEIVWDFGDPHPYPTIDHIIPLSCGGSHSLENAQLAHFICNTRKRNKIL